MVLQEAQKTEAFIWWNVWILNLPSLQAKMKPTHSEDWKKEVVAAVMMYLTMKIWSVFSYLAVLTGRGFLGRVKPIFENRIKRLKRG